MITRCGIIPIAEYSGVILLLLGKETKENGNVVYTDFGGGCEAGETEVECGLRELAEESRGVVKIDLDRTINVIGDNKRIYLVEIDYNCMLPIVFSNTKPSSAEEAELSDLEWLPLESFLQIPERYLANSLKPVQKELQDKSSIINVSDGYIATFTLSNGSILVGTGNTQECAIESLKSLMNYHRN